MFNGRPEQTNKSKRAKAGFFMAVYNVECYP